MAKRQKSERGKEMAKTMTAKQAMEQLASDPTLSLSIAVNGKPLWRHKVAKSQAPILEQRNTCIDKHSGYSSDDLLINVLKMNPGIELQLMSYRGTFPYMALLVHGANKLTVPEGMFVTEGKLCCTEKYFGGTVCLAEIYK